MEGTKHVLKELPREVETPGQQLIGGLAFDPLGQRSETFGSAIA